MPERSGRAPLAASDTEMLRTEPMPTHVTRPLLSDVPTGFMGVSGRSLFITARVTSISTRRPRRITEFIRLRAPCRMVFAWQDLVFCLNCNDSSRGVFMKFTQIAWAILALAVPAGAHAQVQDRIELPIAIGDIGD